MEFLEKISPREYQKEILKTCIEKNCLVVLPTGLGKTLIALMLSIERIKKFPREKIVFLAPTKPLAEQHLLYFKNNLPELFGELGLFTGMVKPEKRKEIWQTAEIIFSTPQCVANDLKKNLYTLENVSLLIEDEAHRCVRNYDYTFIAKKYLEHAMHPRILGLTASPGSDIERVKEICKNLSIEEVELRTRESPDVSSYLQELKFEKIIIEFPQEFVEIKDSLLKIFWNCIDELKNRRVLFMPPTKTELIKLQKRLIVNISKGNRNYNTLLSSSACAQAIKIQHAIELLETQTLGGFNKYLKELSRKADEKENKSAMKLVSKPEFNYSLVKSNELLSKDIEHPKLTKLKEIVKGEFQKKPQSRMMVFSQFRETVQKITQELNSIKNIKAKMFIGQAKKKNFINGNESGLSQKEQKNIIKEFSEGKINILVCTSIGEEGLDISEVSAVIFYEAVPSAIRTIQRRGRTARLNPGKLIMLITKNTRDETHFYISKAKEKRMHSAIDSVKKNFLKKINNETQKTL